MSANAQILDGKAMAAAIRADIRDVVAERVAAGKSQPGLAVVIVGDDGASQLYVQKKHKACQDVGMASEIHNLPADSSEANILALIDTLNHSPQVHGILVQLPLPQHIDKSKVLQKIVPHKDVDGFHPLNMGLLLQNQPGLRPCTPVGIMHLLRSTNQALRGLHAVVVGASLIVGRPMALELLSAECTVTICHIATQDLAAQVKQADVLVVAIGKANVIQNDWIKPGAIVIDVGINRTADGGICGDIAFDTASQRASWITPVPGGVGPMTVAMLLKNTLQAAMQMD